ncbi:SLC13 family permease [Aurantimonas sp. C2-6-R+9]|uniref:SLC13 family permease n=1 Tax=unclassified Aurantimonas TaxID=2638230 RepID=UPI002E17549B|nr:MULTISPECIES: SLC13 family permease [unclassified Aurantimonas]MEC5292430.1 SLC13 family permease [Aurantimonas sp. C2-3-R2]MEC5382981.1 SLC13 family permease [Aurantimonas sp. C2-6-R+9]MEC5413488.1 SLC13 family permease [Aurantimonas sp. C2-4-R8]
MTTDQMILFALFGGVFAMLLWGRFRYDLIAFSALMAGVVLQVVPTKDAFAGFGHPATLVVALVLIVSAGLVRSGAVFLITRTLVDASRSLGAHIVFMGGIGGVLSAFMNNVAALALLMPVGIQMAQSLGVDPDPFLMAVAVAASCAFLTPIGHKNNTLILGPGGYAFGDYWRMGLPLEIIVVAVSVPMILLVWPM